MHRHFPHFLSDKSVFYGAKNTVNIGIHNCVNLDGFSVVFILLYTLHILWCAMKLQVSVQKKSRKCPSNCSRLMTHFNQDALVKHTNQEESLVLPADSLIPFLIYHVPFCAMSLCKGYPLGIGRAFLSHVRASSKENSELHSSDITKYYSKSHMTSSQSHQRLDPTFQTYCRVIGQ